MIEHLELKLSGELPVTRKELFKLVNSWGRKDDFDTDDGFEISASLSKDCYPLENLDVSKIEDLSDIFKESMFNGDLSKWNINSCKNMNDMFSWSEFNNDSLNNWNISNVESMEYLFYSSKFNGDISNWDISNVLTMESVFDFCPFDGNISKWNFNKDVNCNEIFMSNKNFTNKYNNGNMIPNYSNDFIQWFEENRFKIRDINTPKEEVLDFFSFDNKNIELDKEF